MFSIKLLARVSRAHADLHSVLCSSAIVYVCCVPENLFDCGSLYVGVQKVNYRQMIRSIWRIETMVLQEQSQIKTTAKTTRKTVNRLARKQPHLNNVGNHVVPERTKGLQTYTSRSRDKKLDQRDERNVRTSLRRIAFSQRKSIRRWNTDGFPAFVSRRRKV